MPLAALLGFAACVSMSWYWGSRAAGQRAPAARQEPRRMQLLLRGILAARRSDFTELGWRYYRLALLTAGGALAVLLALFIWSAA